MTQNLNLEGNVGTKIIQAICVSALLFVVSITSVHAKQAVWSRTNGPSNPTVLAVGTNNNSLFAGTASGLFRSADQGNSWQLLNLGFANPIPFCVSVDQKGNVMSGVADLANGNVSVFISSDNGESWSLSGLSLANGKQILALASNPANVLYAATELGLYRSTDEGATWNLLTNGLPESMINDVVVAQNGNILAGTESEGAFISEDQGSNWSKISSGLSVFVINSFMVANTGEIFIGSGGPGTEGGIFVSADHGLSWQKTTFADIAVYDIIVNRNNSVFTTNGVQIYRSDDLGATWVAFGESLPVNSALAIDAQGIIYIATFGGGVYRSINTTTDIEFTPQMQPTSFTLHQNYPNPFNPSTKIRYDLPTSAQVSVTIYTVLGEKVRTLIAGQQTAGAHTVQWDGRDESGSQVSSGVYIYNIESYDPAGGKRQFVQARKMLLMR